MLGERIDFEVEVQFSDPELVRHVLEMKREWGRWVCRLFHRWRRQADQELELELGLLDLGGEG